MIISFQREQTINFMMKTKHTTKVWCVLDTCDYRHDDSQTLARQGSVQQITIKTRSTFVVHILSQNLAQLLVLEQDVCTEFD